MDRDELEARRAVVRRLRQVLDQHEITQTAFARLLGQAPSGISDWFTKGALPNGETLIRLCQLPMMRNVSLEWLFTGEGSPLRARHLPEQRAYDLGGIAALTQAADEIDRLKQLWLSSQRGGGLEITPPDSRAAAASIAAASARRATALRSKRGKKAG